MKNMPGAHVCVCVPKFLGEYSRRVCRVAILPGGCCLISPSLPLPLCLIAMKKKKKQKEIIDH